jgi:hypothetical protein
LLSDDDNAEDFTTGHMYLAHAPHTYQQVEHAVNSEKWQEAMQDQLDKMEKYRVWDVINREDKLRVVGAKWVYMWKIDGDRGRPTSYKARWVAKGYSQHEGVHFIKLFAWPTIRTFLGLVNKFDMDCDQVNIKAAFLNVDLGETIYLSAPEGCNIPANKVLLLRKSLYGLNQSPRCFKKVLNAWLKTEGPLPTRAAPSLYIRRQQGHFLMLLVHLDDQLIACNNQKVLDDFKRTLNNKFECYNSGPAVSAYQGLGPPISWYINSDVCVLSWCLDMSCVNVMTKFGKDQGKRRM